jgi:hypothetical protein
MPEDVRELSEKVEDRTNRQLRETLVFKNIPEVRNGDETYKDTKELLATTISEYCVDVSYDDALSQIKRAHRESGRRRDDEEEHPRVGKRIIYAAFHSWDMCQLIIEFEFEISNTFSTVGLLHFRHFLIFSTFLSIMCDRF